MKRIFIFLLILIFVSAGYCQKAEKYFKKGMDRQQKQKYQKAIDFYTKAIAVNPDYAEAYCNRGKSKGELHDYYAEFIDCSIAINIKPDYAEAYVYRGIAKIILYENSGSVGLVRPIEVNTKSGQKPSDTLVNTGKGTVHLTKANNFSLTSAIGDFDQSIKINPAYGEAYYYRGIAKIKADQKKSGCLDFQKAKESGYDKAGEAMESYCK